MGERESHQALPAGMADDRKGCEDQPTIERGRQHGRTHYEGEGQHEVSFRSRYVFFSTRCWDSADTCRETIRRFLNLFRWAAI